MSKELADRIVALGVGGMTKNGTTGEMLYYTPFPVDHLRAHNFVRDGRVVLALMEKCQLSFGRIWDQAGIQYADDLRIAIATACCEALEQ